MSSQTRGKGRGRKVRPNSDGTRMCAACRARAERGQLARFVIDADGQLFYDRHRKAPGRGAHLCYRLACVESAAKSKAFHRAFRRPVKGVTAADIVKLMTVGIAARIENALRIGGQAGWIVSGTDVLLRSASRVVLMVIAEDVAENSVKRLSGVVSGDPENVIRFGTASFLGMTQGKEARVALGVTDTGWAESLKSEFARRNGVLVVQSVESR